MKIKLKTNDLLSLLNEDISLEIFEREDIDNYIDKRSISKIDEDYKIKIKKIAYLSFQNNKKIEAIINDDKLQLNSDVNAILSTIYNKDEFIEVNVLDDLDRINSLLKGVDFTILNNVEISTTPIFGNVLDIIKNIDIKKELNNKIEQDVENIKKEQESRDLLKIIHERSPHLKSIYFLKPKHVDDFIDYIIRHDNFDYIPLLKVMEHYMYYMKKIHQVEKLLDLDNYSNQIMNFIIEEFRNERVNTEMYNKYVEFLSSGVEKFFKKDFLIKEYDNIVNKGKKIENYLNLDDFYLASKSIIKKLKDILSSKETLLSENISSDFIYKNKKMLPKDLLLDKDVFMKMLPKLKKVDLVNKENFTFLENLKSSELAEMWLLNSDVLVCCDSFLKGVNKKKAFMEFILKVKELNPVNYKEDHYISSLHFRIYRRLKKDKDIVNFLLDEDFKFDFIEDLPSEDFDVDLLDKIYAKGLYHNLPLSVKLKEENPSRIIALLNHHLNSDQLRMSIPKEWLTREILNSLRRDVFQSLHLSRNKDFNIHEFTGGSFDNYVDLIKKDSSLFSEMPNEIKENKEFFDILIGININLAIKEMPNKFIFDSEYMLNLISENSKFLDLIPDIMWETEGFLMKFLNLLDDHELMENENIESWKSYLPKEIKNFFSELEIKSDYSKVINKYYLDATLPKSQQNHNKIIKI